MLPKRRARLQGRRCRDRRCTRPKSVRLLRARRCAEWFARARAPDAYRALTRVPRELALDVTFGSRLTLIPQFLALGQADLDLHLTARKIQAQRHDRQAFLRRAPAETRDLLLVKQQLARAVRID